MTALIRVEVVHALPARQWSVVVDLPEGATVRDAFSSASVANAAALAGADLDNVGIWNRLATGDTILKDGDRVELYRPLIADPKDARRRRSRPYRAR